MSTVCSHNNYGNTGRKFFSSKVNNDITTMARNGLQSRENDTETTTINSLVHTESRIT